MIGPGLFTLLSTEPTISNLVADRIYPLLLPTGSATDQADSVTMPAVTYQIVGGSSQPTLTERGFQKVRVQLDCWGSDYLSADLVRDAVTTFLSGKRFTLADGTLVSFQYINPIDFYASGDELFRCGVEFYAMSYAA